MITAKLSDVLAKESNLTLAAINAVANMEAWQFNSNRDSWDRFYLGNIATGVKNRLTKKFSQIGLEFSAEALHNLSTEDKNLIATMNEVNNQRIRENIRQKALKYCLDHKDLIEKWLFEGYRLHVQQWTGSARHKRLVSTEEGVLYDNIIKAFEGVSVQEGNDAPRGGSAGKFYAFAGTELEAEGWHADMLMWGGV